LHREGDREREHASAAEWLRSSVRRTMSKRHVFRLVAGVLRVRQSIAADVALDPGKAYRLDV
jgi:hypothetical protein